MAQVADADILVFDCLGAGVLDIEPKQLQSLRVGGDSPILAIEQEKIVSATVGAAPPKELDWPTEIPPWSPLKNGGKPEFTAVLKNGGKLEFTAPLFKGGWGYLTLSEKYCMAIDEETNSDSGENRPEHLRYLSEKYPDNLLEWEATWGLQATDVLRSRFSGSGIKIAVLDTGLDLTHPDFVGRQIVSQSFVPDEEVQDANGHGTHCIGTACGSLFPQILPRYGIAYHAKIYAGKVLSNQGSGLTSQIWAGMEWAIANNCQIISMSLGRPTKVGESYSPTYETLARRALRQGTLIVAAAGNASKRHKGIINPVGHPANCPSVLAVGAIDSQFQIARFSNRGINPIGGRIDLAAPGVDIYSSYPMPQKYKRLRGTSMATPHVAGIAALYAEATGCTGADLWQLLVSNARPLPLPAADVGSGLVRSPG
ncbi:MAG: S8 family serine peptidase [Oscillatoria sp. SIO1A7]|nr:S8 family serine peptidase [Oscillatoria sp. SIO1A7]